MKRVLILVLVLSVLPLSSSWAQDDGADEKSIQFNTSIGVGSTLPLNPDEFDSGWNPSIGFMVDVGAARGMLEASVNLDYSFFREDLNRDLVADDINIFTTFLNFKVKPLNTTARPYIFVGAGWYRFWLVEMDIYENVLGYGGGAGVEIELDESRRIFIEGKLIQGQTRLRNNLPTYTGNETPAEEMKKQKEESVRNLLGNDNTETIPIRAGITFVF
jgi:hypothetical protein